MNYDKLSRSLRYYYEKGIMQKVAGKNSTSSVSKKWERFTTINGDTVACEFPADDDETTRVNKGPKPSQLCQGPWPVGHGPCQS